MSQLIQYEVEVHLCDLVNPPEFAGWLLEDSGNEIYIYQRVFQVGFDIQKVVESIRVVLMSVITGDNLAQDKDPCISIRGGSSSIVLTKTGFELGEADWRDLLLLGPVIGALGFAFGLPVTELFNHTPAIIHGLDKMRKRTATVTGLIDSFQSSLDEAMSDEVETDPDDRYDDELERWDWWCNFGGYNSDWTINADHNGSCTPLS